MNVWEPGAIKSQVVVRDTIWHVTRRKEERESE